MLPCQLPPSPLELLGRGIARHVEHLVRVGAEARFGHPTRLPPPARLLRARAQGYRGPMQLPVQPPIEPMLAKPVDGIPDGDGWMFEPKWDGFRAIVFRDGDEVYIQSRDLKPLDRYFPELAEPLRANL